MTLPRSAADVLSGHVVFEVESIDRMYLNVWQPRLQHGAGARWRTRDADTPTRRAAGWPASESTERDYDAPAFTDSGQRRFSTQFSTQRGSAAESR